MFPTTSAADDIEANLLLTAALQAGFTGGFFVDFPHASAAKKFYLCLEKGPTDSLGDAPRDRAGTDLSMHSCPLAWPSQACCMLTWTAHMQRSALEDTCSSRNAASVLPVEARLRADHTLLGKRTLRMLRRCMGGGPNPSRQTSNSVGAPQESKYIATDAIIVHPGLVPCGGVLLLQTRRLEGAQTALPKAKPSQGFEGNVGHITNASEAELELIHSLLGSTEGMGVLEKPSTRSMLVEESAMQAETWPACLTATLEQLAHGTTEGTFNAFLWIEPLPGSPSSDDLQGERPSPSWGKEEGGSSDFACALLRSQKLPPFLVLCWTHAEGGRAPDVASAVARLAAFCAAYNATVVGGDIVVSSSGSGRATSSGWVLYVSGLQELDAEELAALPRFFGG